MARYRAPSRPFETNSYIAHWKGTERNRIDVWMFVHRLHSSFPAKTRKMIENLETGTGFRLLLLFGWQRRWMRARMLEESNTAGAPLYLALSDRAARPIHRRANIAERFPGQARAGSSFFGGTNDDPVIRWNARAANSLPRITSLNIATRATF